MVQQSAKFSYRLRNEKKFKNATILLEGRWGQAYRAYRERWFRASRLLTAQTDFPMHIDLDSADLCNLHCLYCSEEHEYIRKRTGKELSDSLVDAIFKEVRQPAGKDRLCAMAIGTLGEPFLFPEKVYNILEKSNEADVMETFMHTNATLFTAEKYKPIIDLELKYLFFSIDAIKPGTYRIMRGADLLIVMKNILNFIEYKRTRDARFPLTRVSFLETTENKTEKEEFINFWQDKVDMIDIQAVTEYTTTLAKNVEIKYTCDQPFQRMAIGAEGQIGMCSAGYTMLPDFYVGLFPQMSIYEAWNCQKAQLLRKAMIEKKFGELPVCFECLSRYVKRT